MYPCAGTKMQTNNINKYLYTSKTRNFGLSFVEVLLWNHLRTISVMTWLSMSREFNIDFCEQISMSRFFFKFDALNNGVSETCLIKSNRLNRIMVNGFKKQNCFSRPPLSNTRTVEWQFWLLILGTRLKYTIQLYRL